MLTNRAAIFGATGSNHWTTLARGIWGANGACRGFEQVNTVQSQTSLMRLTHWNVLQASPTSEPSASGAISNTRSFMSAGEEVVSVTIFRKTYPPEALGGQR